MEPVTKKAKHEPTALHEAIANTPSIQFQDVIDLFHSNKDATKIKDANGNYPLYLLCRQRERLSDRNLIPFAMELLSYYPDALCQECWEDGFTNPLHMVAFTGDHQLVEMILKKNISLLNKLDEGNQTPLQVACCSGSNRKCVENILQFPGVIINSINNEGETALLSCAKSGDWRIVLKLLRYPGIDVQVLDKEGRLASFYFLKKMSYLKFKKTKRSPIMQALQLFMTFPGVFKWKSTVGEKILFAIVQWNNPHILSAVLSCNKGLITECDDLGCTPLHMACHSAHIKYLLQNNNDVNEVRDAYLECLNILVQNIDGQTINKFVRVSVDDDSNGTALHFACLSENYLAVKALLQHPEINYNLFDNCGDTPLFKSIMVSEDMFKEAETHVCYCWHEAWNLTCLRLLLNRNEGLIFTRNKEGNQLLDMARKRLLQICNAPKPIHLDEASFKIHQEILTVEFIEIIDELEDFMAKGRWKMFRDIHKMSLTRP